MPGEELIIGPVLGQLMAQANDARQMQMQGRLMQQQMAGQMALTDYNQKVALDTWEKTNYAAQVKQMEKAGLNVGLMYKQGGPGGSLAVTPGSVTGGQAPHGGGEQLAGLMAAAQIKLMEAQIRDTNADASNKEAVNPYAAPGAAAGVKEKEAGARLTGLKADYQQIENQIQSSNTESLVNQLRATASKSMSDARSAAAQAGVDEATATAKIQAAYLGNVEQTFNILAQKAGIINKNKDTELKQKQITDLAVNIFNKTNINGKDWREYSLEEKRVAILDEAQKLKGAQFDYQQMKDALDATIGVFDNVADVIGQAVKAPSTIINKTTINTRPGRRP